MDLQRRHAHRPRRTNLLPVSCWLLLLSGLLAGCGGLGSNGQATGIAAQSAESLCQRQWLLEELQVDGREHKLSMFWQKMWRSRPYLTCDKLGFVRGSAGSNPYLGKFDLSDSGAIQWLKPPEISRMGAPRESSELERDFLLALPRVNQADLQGDTLVLNADDGTRLLFRQTRELPPSS